MRAAFAIAIVCLASTLGSQAVAQSDYANVDVNRCRRVAFPLQTFAEYAMPHGEALAACRKAVSLNPADRNLTLSLVETLLITRQADEALSLALPLAEAGEPRAQYFAGVAYLSDMFPIGDTVPVDRAKAIAWLEKAAAQDLPAAIVALGDLHLAGRGFPANEAIAEQLFRRASALDYSVAETRIGVSLAINAKTLDEFAVSLPYFQRGRDRGDDLAMNVLRQLLFDADESFREQAEFSMAEGRQDALLQGARQFAQMAEIAFGKDSWEAAVGTNRLARQIREAGKPEDAEDLYREVLGVLGDRSDQTEFIIQTLDNIGYTLNEQGRFKEAEPFFLNVRRKYEQLGQTSDVGYATALNNIAQNLDLQGDYDRARPLHEAAYALLVSLKGRESFDASWSEINFGLNLLWSGRSAEAIPKLEHAVRVRGLEAGESSPLFIAGLQYLAEAQLAAGDSASAAKTANTAFELALFSRGASHPDTLNSRRLRILAGLATGGNTLDDARILLADSRKRRSEAGQGMSALRVVRRAEREQHSFASIFIDSAWNHSRAIASGQPQIGVEAFVTAQDLFAGVASQALARSAALRAASRAGVQAEAEDRDRLIDRWNSLDRQIVSSFSEAGAEPRRENLRKELTRVEDQLKAVEERLRAKAPDYYALIRPAALPLEAVQALLGPDEAALMLASTEFGTHLMVVSDTGLAWQRAGLTKAQADEAVHRLLGGFGGERSGESEILPDYDLATAHLLYDELIAPIAPAFAGKKRLFFSASGALASLPLGILAREVPAEGSPDEQLRATRWFADDVAISVIPSLQSLQFIRQFRQDGGTAGGKPYLGFGDPLLTDHDANQQPAEVDYQKLFGIGARRGATGGIASPRALMDLGRIKGTATEIEAQWQALGRPAQAKFLGKEATETRVRSTPLRAGVIAFATHGLLAGQLDGNGEPGLVFTPPVTPSEDDDGYLAASEIGGLRIAADWVLLSACNTAAGEGGSAEGLSGLARAFFFAGATNLLVSHWLVSDDVAPVLTLRAIELARDDPTLSRAEALQRAMREVRSDPQHPEWAHPFFWAPFSFVGDGAR